MKLAIRFFPLLAAIISDPQFTQAQELKGIPRELIGNYGPVPNHCRSYHRKSADEIRSLTDDTYVFSTGSCCHPTVLSHRKTPKGYSLRLMNRGDLRVPRLDIEILGNGFYFFDKEMLERCSEQNIRAGVGLRTTTTDYPKSPREIAFSVYYALETTNRCSGLAINEAKARELLQLAQTADKDIQAEQNDAKNAVNADFEKLKDFCAETQKVFGLGGRVIHDLLLRQQR